MTHINPYEVYRSAVVEARTTLEDASNRCALSGHQSIADELMELAELLRVAQNDHDFIAAQRCADRG